MIRLNDYLRNEFGCKVYKISLNGGFTCPNRDGKLDTRGCIFCSGYGSGDFSEDAGKSVYEQIEDGKKRVEAKMPRQGQNHGYIAYFQAFTNTYAPVERLRELYTAAVSHPDIVALSIATRPDCVGEGVLKLLEEIDQIKPVWVELGLQTIHERTADYIRRGFKLGVYDETVRRLKAININVITHVILGLPGETREDMLETVNHVGKSGSDGIKLQLLHVIEGTDLADDYRQGLFECMSMDEYVELIYDCIKILPDDMVIHRMTGDGARKTLIAPLWSLDKKRVLNSINKRLSVLT